MHKDLQDIETCPKCGYRALWENFLINENFTGCPCCMAEYKNWSIIKKEAEDNWNNRQTTK